MYHACEAYRFRFLVEKCGSDYAIESVVNAVDFRGAIVSRTVPDDEWVSPFFVIKFDDNSFVKFWSNSANPIVAFVNAYRNGGLNILYQKENT